MNHCDICQGISLLEVSPDITELYANVSCQELLRVASSVTHIYPILVALNRN